MLLDLCFTPLQVVEQSPHTLHCVKRQSTAGSQAVSMLQNSVSVSFPVAGRPQALAIVATLRRLKVTPVPQDFEQGDHGSQSCQAPSWHVESTQGWVLQGTTSSSSPSTGAPPFKGMTAISLDLSI